MGRANVYLPDDLERRVKAAQIPISEICQQALRVALEAAEASAQPFADTIRAQFRRGGEAGAAWTHSASHERLLALIRDQRLEEIPADVRPSDLPTLPREQALAWEAGFTEAARSTVRSALAAAVPVARRRALPAPAGAALAYCRHPDQRS